MTSRFFGGGESSSNSSSGSDDSSSEDEQAKAAVVAGARRPQRWASASSSDDEEVAEKRTVRTKQDKRFEQLQTQAKLAKNHMKIDDFGALITDYETLFKMRDKLKNIIEKEEDENVFIRAIATLEMYCAETHAKQVENKAAGGKALSQANQKHFNTLRAKVRKGNRDFEERVTQFKEHPSDFDDEPEEAEEEPSSDSDSEDAGGKGSSSSSSGSSSSSSGSDSDSSSSSSGSGSDSDSDSSSDDNSWSSGKSSGSGRGGQDEDEVRERKMMKWLITDEVAAKRERKEKEKGADGEAKREKDKKPRKNKEVKEESKDQKKDESKEKDEYTAEELLKKTQDIAQARGRRGFDKRAYSEHLAELIPHAVKLGPLFHLYILSLMVSADFDNTGSAFASMKIELWNEALDKVNQMMPLLAQAHQKLLDEGLTPKEILTVDENSEEPTAYARQQQTFVSFADKLDDELYKAFQLTQDVYGAEYNDVLANSSKILRLQNNLLKFFVDTNQRCPLSAVALRLMNQLYFKPDSLNAAIYSSIQRMVPEEEKDNFVWPEDSCALISQLCRYVFAAAEPREQHRALLIQAYHLALQGSFHGARDLLHLCNLHEKACEADVHIQIMYNRVVAQMGLSAFRLGKIQDAHNCLMDVYSHNNRARELLAQGMAFGFKQEKTEEQERSERLRQLPYHMHINTEVLECAHHICAMLMEVPNLAMQSMDPTNKRVISRVLRRALEAYDKSPFNGPPENNREAVVHAAKRLQRGDWQSACAALESLKIWDHIDMGCPENGEKVKEMIKQKIKIEALRTYLFAYASIYDAFHLDQLVGMFDLPDTIVHSIVSKMMIKEEITAFWDESSTYLLVQHVEPTPLQRLALALADRGAAAVQMNEGLVDHKTGGYGFKDATQGKGGGRWDDGGGRKGKGKGGQGFDDRKGKGKGRGKMRAGTAADRGFGNARLALGGSGIPQRSGGGAGASSWR